MDSFMALFQKAKPWSRIATLLLAVASFSLSGCTDFYSEAIFYDVRTDPIFKELPAFPEPHYEPDPPGQLPLMSIADMKDTRNPYSELPEDFKGKVIDVTNIRKEDKLLLQSALDQMFGTPGRPWVDVPMQGKYQDYEKDLELDISILKRGSLLYRKHCLLCHGITGNGRGSSSIWVNPHPRDYRLGKFKFQSRDQTKLVFYKPSREDLFRTLHYGVEGTSMPSFNQLNPEDLDALVSYVIHLSIRGETEYIFFESLKNVDGVLMLKEAGGDIPNFLALIASTRVKSWVDSQSPNVDIPVPSDPIMQIEDESKRNEALRSSVRRGYAMFLGDADKLMEEFPEEKFKAAYPNRFKKDAKGKTPSYKNAITSFANSVKCMECHTDYGRQAPYKFDEWGTLVKPADLTVGVYRGGRRPIDIYWRIHSGIAGAGMAAYGDVMNGSEIWDMVHFVRALPYRQMMKNEYGIEIK